MSAALTEALTPPANPLCDSEHASDVINAAQSALRFLRDAKGDDADEEDQDFLSGREWLWGMIHDALAYAAKLADRDNKVARHSPQV